MSSCDVAVVGAGSNSLSAAAYLAKAGKRVLVLEANAVCGGGVVSVSPAPGFTLDSHACAFSACLPNPTLLNDELGLKSRFGLEFIYPGLNAATHFEDGRGILLHADLDRTCQSIASYSEHDAEAYRRLTQQALKLMPVLLMGYFSPPLPFGEFMAMLDQSAFGQDLIGALLDSGYDLLEQHFESSELKVHLYKFLGEFMLSPETKGTGIVLLMVLGMMHSYETGIVRGGSHKLTDALIRCIESYGGEVRTGAEVRRIVMAGGRATGVELADGEVVRARDAVLANIHPWDLGDMIEGLDPAMLKRAKAVRLSDYGAMNQLCALSEPPIYKTGPAYVGAVTNEFSNADFASMRKTFDALRYGEMPLKNLSPLACVNSAFDPSLAPPGKAALYLYHFAPLADPRRGKIDWDATKAETADAVFEYFCSHTLNIDRSKLIGRIVETPLDHHRHSRNMRYGDIFGCGSFTSQFMGRRPIPELAQYRVPGVEGIYLTGPTMHPGGGVTLGGRATAMRMLMDWKMDLKTVFEMY